MYDNIPILVEGIKRYGEVKDPHWLVFGNEFVFEIHNNPLVRDFLAKVTQAKIEVERKMRKELDEKLLYGEKSDQV